MKKIELSEYAKDVAFEWTFPTVILSGIYLLGKRSGRKLGRLETLVEVKTDLVNKLVNEIKKED